MHFKALLFAFDVLMFSMLIGVTGVVFGLDRHRVGVPPQYVPLAGIYLVIGAIILVGLRVWMTTRLREETQRCQIANS